MNATTAPERNRAPKSAKASKAKKAQIADSAVRPEETVLFGELPMGPATGLYIPPAHSGTSGGSLSELPPAKPLLTKAQVCVLMKLSSRSLDKMLGRREFPAPVRLGKSDYWSPLPVQHWLERKFAVQEAWRIS